MSGMLFCRGLFRVQALAKACPQGSQGVAKTAVRLFKDAAATTLSRWRPVARQRTSLARAVAFGLVGLKTAAPETAKREIASSGTGVKPSRSRPGGDGDVKQGEPGFDWWRFLELLSPQAWHLIAAILSAMAAAYLNIQIPAMLGNIVNVVSGYVPKGTSSSERCFTDDIREPALQMVKMYLAQGLFTFGYIYSLSCLGERIACRMRSLLFSSLVRQDMAFFDSRRSGELVSRLTTDVQDFKSSFKMCISQGLRSVAQAVGCGVVLYRISPQLTLAMLVVVPAIVSVGTMLGSLLRKLSKRAQDQVAKATAVGEECLSNVRTVRAFAMEDMERSLFDSEAEEARKLNERLGLGIGLFQAATNVFLNGIVLSTLYYGGYLLSGDQLSAGDLMSFLVATQTIQRSLAQLSLLFGHYVKGVAAGARVFEYIRLEPTIPETGGATIPFHSLLGDVEFRNVTFEYPTRPGQTVLDGFNLRIPPGRVVALVGESGGGKSTVAALLERFYDADGGGVFLDGKDVRQLDARWLRGKALGFIGQEPVLFATSVRENIRYGRPDATDQEVYEAAKLANAHDFIKGFPSGYDTVVGERGVTVSGGQKQRIAIARALLKNPSVLILDEATSALDAESEKIVQEALDSATKGRTVLVIAHRLSTVQNADVIAVISGGRVEEIGTHQDLKKAGGKYANLIRRQEADNQGPSPSSRSVS